MTQSNPSGDAFNDSLNFVKKLWGQMGVPGMPSAPGMTIPGMPNMPLPSMSLEDLDKRIQELKTVETWLNVNMTMLRNTIQALEVQRATIATLHSLSSTMSKTMQGMNSGENMYPFTGSPAKSAESKPEVDTKSEESATSEKSKASHAKGAASGTEETSPLISQSAVWWQNVQDQFKQALGTALEKSAANYEAAKSVSENLVKSSAKKSDSKSAAPAKTAKKPLRKAPARSSTRAAAKPRTSARKVS
ncbi:hypothetical protein AAKU67_003590 [Oxalobacteraceae bacterium GrIS 2.11]